MDQFFAYVGGLIGSVVGVIFIVHVYNELCYYMSLGHKVMVDNEGREIDQHFNFLNFLQYMVYSVVSICGCCKDWTAMQTVDSTTKEVKRQLDVGLLIKRIIFLEKCVTQLMGHSPQEVE